MKVYQVAEDLGFRRTGHVKTAQSRGDIPTLAGSVKPVRVPSPKQSPLDIGVEELAQHLAHLYSQAQRWSGRELHNEGVKQAYWMCLGVLRKDKWDLARRMKAALRALKDASSSGLPLSMYAWWMCNKAWEDKKIILSPQGVFNPDQISTPRWRAYYWKDCGEIVKATIDLWPKSTNKLACLLRDMEEYDAFTPSPSIARDLWDIEFSTTYKLVMRECLVERNVIAEKVHTKHEAFDIGMYIVPPVEHLKLKSYCITSVK